MKPAGKRRLSLLTDGTPERREGTRFRLALEVRYNVSQRRWRAPAGTGLTIDISSSGMSFIADRPLGVGQRLSLSMDWPVTLDQGVQLQLTMSGVVVRTEGTVTALRIEHHEFKTRRLGPRVVPTG